MQRLSPSLCLLAASPATLLLAAVAPAAHADLVDGDFWTSRTVVLPQTRLFAGKIGTKQVWLRVAPQRKKTGQYLGEAFVTETGPSRISENYYVDGLLRSGTLTLRQTSFDWDKNKPVSKPAFTLQGWNSRFPARLTGTGRDENASRPVQLREVAFRFPGGAKLTTARIAQNFPKTNYNIALRYPQLVRGTRPLSPAIQQFNREINRSALASYNEFKHQMKDYDSADADPKYKPPTAYTAGAFTLTWAASDLASGDLIQDVFYGGAHGVMMHSPLTYDFKRNRKLALSDLFVPGTPYLQNLANLSRPAIRRWMAPIYAVDEQQLKEGTTPTADNYDVWTLTPLGLQITFVDYQVGPYAQGESNVVIPYSSLKGILKPEFVTRLKL